MNNLSSYCRLVDEKITASDKDLPVLKPNEFNGDALSNTFARFVETKKYFLMKTTATS